MHNVNTYSGRLGWAIEQTGRSIRSVALETGMAPASLEYLLKKPNLKKPSKYSARLAAVLGVRPEWLRAKDGEPYEEGRGPVDESAKLLPAAAPVAGPNDDRVLTDLCIAAIERFGQEIAHPITTRQSIMMYRLLYSYFFDRRATATVQTLVDQLHYLRETMPPL